MYFKIREGFGIKTHALIIWLTQLGLTVAAPLAGFVLIAVWLRERYNLGSWVLWTGLILGIMSALSGLRSSLRILDKLSSDKKDDTPPPVSFNDHH